MTAAPAQRGFSLLEALASVVVVGVGVLLFLKTQGMTRKDGRKNSNMLMAGQLIDEQIENLRISIAQDTNANWPPATGVSVVDRGITIERTVSAAVSPKDGANIPNARRLDLVAFWGSAPRTSQDTLRITTYVSKRF